ncbi:MAG: hypothetical protein JWO82_4102 [Akkermansiaceae bacterium]|nr:hypothetical protein [Akkermansiaceae bacterium]
MAGWIMGLLLGGGPVTVIRGAEPGAPVRETADDAPDPGVALMGLVREGGLDPERAEQLRPLLLGGNYREALRVRGEMKDAEGRAALGRFIWQRWLALDRDKAFRSLREIRDEEGGELEEAYAALSWLVSGRLYADRVKWCEQISSAGAEDVRLKRALLEGMAETWLADGEATTADLIRRAEGVPVRERMESFVSGFARCCEVCDSRIRTRDMSWEQAAGVVAAMREVVEWAAVKDEGDAGAEGRGILTASKLPEQLGELAGQVSGPEKALTERPLPEAFRKGFARGVGRAAWNLKPGEVLHLPAGDDPAVLTGVWAGYLGVRGGETKVAAYAAWFDGVELSGLPLQLAARGALRTRREEVDLSEERLAQILKLTKGPFRTEAVLYAGRLLKEKKWWTEADEFLRAGLYGN